jgi:outer membrane lipoprotein-sorting protein
MTNNAEMSRSVDGRRIHWRQIALGVTLGLFALPSAAQVAGQWSVGELMRQLALHPGGRATFVERKYLAILDQPVESSGELLFIPPARMEKRTLKPKPELLLLDGDSLTMERGRQKSTLSLSQYPEVAPFVESIRGTLAGDLRALQSQYRVDLDGEPARWQLTLLPSDTKIAAVILRIRIAGAQDEVRSIEILQTDGDRSVMTISKAVAR